MLNQIGYDAENIKKRLGNKPAEDYISIIDPSCGSGTFLYSALDQLIRAVPNGSEESSKKIEELINNNIFGLDIAEFPLYLAEMNILMRMLPLIINEKYNNPIDKKIKVFLTKDSIAEFINAGLKNTINDIHIGGRKGSLFSSLDFEYESFMREKGDLAEMKESMHPPRRRFDYVIGNPPYIGYNECSKQGLLIVKLIQDKKAQMSDIYGVNLNTVPGRVKAYAPKPNLYAFFIALGIALLKDNGKLCYIIPQTILTTGDLDVLRYHLAKFATVEKIITFSGKMFVGRGLKQDKPVATSSLVFVVRKRTPALTDQVEVIHYNDPDDNIEKCLKNILAGKKISKKKILQGKLLQNVANWNFIKQGKKTLEFFDYYKEKEKFDIYRIPELSKSKFNSTFYFDKGLVFPKNKIYKESDLSDKFDYFYLIKADRSKYNLLLSGEIVKQDDISFPKGSQGIKVYNQKYKIIWSYMNSDRFYFTDKKVMINFNWVMISSDCRQEMIYIFSLLNSNLNKFVFDNLLKNENEKDILIGIKTIKEFIRIPKITEDNQSVKDEIIKKTEEMLALEEIKLSDLIDFSQVMMQKFDGIETEDNNLILIKGGKRIKCKIKNNDNLVKKILKEQFKNKLFKDKEINLQELKSLSAIDFDKQKSLKNYIDDLVFALYFNVRLKEIGFNKAKSIKKECEKNEFYKIISKYE